MDIKKLPKGLRDKLNRLGLRQTIFDNPVRNLDWTMSYYHNVFRGPKNEWIGIDSYEDKYKLKIFSYYERDYKPKRFLYEDELIDEIKEELEID